MQKECGLSWGSRSKPFRDSENDRRSHSRQCLVWVGSYLPKQVTLWGSEPISIQSPCLLLRSLSTQRKVSPLPWQRSSRYLKSSWNTRVGWDSPLDGKGFKYLWGWYGWPTCSMLYGEDILVDWQTRVVVPIFKKREQKVCQSKDHTS